MDQPHLRLNLPLRLQAGDSFTPDPIDLQPTYPASAWNMVMFLFLADGQGTAKAQIAATASGDLFVLAMAPTETSPLAPGEYHWLLVVTSADGTQRKTVARGQIAVDFNPASPAANRDVRTHAEKCLAAITAVLEGRLSESITEYKLDAGLEAKHMDHAELIKLRAWYAGVVRRQRGAPFFTHVPVRFGVL